MSKPGKHHHRRLRSVKASFTEVFLAFFKLGLVSFGGPIAHLGYFRQAFVARYKWVDDGQFSQLIALCQFLPGPASSQVGFAIGLMRSGFPGALAAFIGFTLPSALCLYLFALFVPALTGAASAATIHGLKLVALVVVFQGVMAMARRLCPETRHRIIAAVAASALILSNHASTQIIVLLLAGLAGMLTMPVPDKLNSGVLSAGFGKKTGALILAVFFLLLFGLPVAASDNNGFLTISEAFYRAGALVFGGGHVVLPLLEESVVKGGWLSRDIFLAGYGAAQAVPGPMFSLAAYLGASLPAQLGGWVGAILALSMIFLPGLLLVSAALPYWETIFSYPYAARAIAGVNASVVGILAAALYDPIWISTINGPADILIAGSALAIQLRWRVSTLVVITWCITLSIVRSLLVF